MHKPVLIPRQDAEARCSMTQRRQAGGLQRCGWLQMHMQHVLVGSLTNAGLGCHKALGDDAQPVVRCNLDLPMQRACRAQGSE